MKFNMFGTFGSVREYVEGEWFWELTSCGTLVGRGKEKSRKAAEEALKKSLGDYALMNAKDGVTKSRQSQELRRITQTRPYLMAHVCELLAVGSPKNQIVREAEEREKHIWELDKKRRKLSTHGKTAKAYDLAAKTLDYMTALEMVSWDGMNPTVNAKFAKFVRKMFGPDFLNGKMAAELNQEDAA